MKKLFKAFIFCMITFTSYCVQAQDNRTMHHSQKIYFRVCGGYSFESGKTEFNDADPNGLTGIKQSTDVTVNGDGSSANLKSLNGTLGAGIKANITAGYMFDQYIGVELSVNYFHSNKTMIGRLRSPKVISEENTFLRGFDVAPGIFLTPNFKTINPYARIGLIVPIGGELTIETRAKKINGGGAGTDIMVEAISEVKSRFSVGYYGAMGVSYPFNHKMSIFGEMEIKHLSIKSKSAEVKEYATNAITNGQSQLIPGQQLTDLPVYEKQFDFTNEYNQSMTTSPNQSEPLKVPMQFVNVGSVGFNVGLRFTF